MSCPSEVVPSRWSPDGGRAGGKASLFGSVTDVNSCGTAASTMKTPKITRPIRALRLRSTERRKPPPRRRGVGGAGAAVVSNAVTASPLRPGPRVEPRGREVAEQHRDQHGDGEQH